MRFNEQVALITGAASGIGRATAMRLAEEGARVALVDRNAELLTEVERQLPASAQAMSFPLDVSDEAAVEACASAVIGRFGKVDVLCNIAGVACGREIATEQNMDTWRKVLDVNLLGTVHFTKYAARDMQKRNKGAVVNAASVAGIRSGAGGNAYSASKAAVINFTQTAACDLGEWNIRVNAICPGLVETGMTQPIFDLAREKGKEEKLGERCELRRYGRPEELAAVFAFLASDDASFITGQALAVDGGNTASLNMPGMKV